MPYGKELRQLKVHTYDNGDGFTDSSLDAPGAGKTHLIWGATNTKTVSMNVSTDSARIFMLPPETTIMLPAPISAGENKAVEVSQDDAQIFYTTIDVAVTKGRY
jgi:hypothetical protein